ncbi:SOH1-domain-containing protein [Chytridium lagenaria]|nr:SOH1-domain-containing protein [Chytridium lagenaria]
MDGQQTQEKTLEDIVAEAASSRFMRELEFVQCLANPKYLQFLAQNRYFDDEAFLNYLKYLSYWREPQYAKFIVYPYCLEMLDYLQFKAFREAVASENTVHFIHQKEFYHWNNWRAKHPGPFPEEEEEGEEKKNPAAPPSASVNKQNNTEGGQPETGNTSAEKVNLMTDNAVPNNAAGAHAPLINTGFESVASPVNFGTTLPFVQSSVVDGNSIPFNVSPSKPDLPISHQLLQDHTVANGLSHPVDLPLHFQQMQNSDALVEGSNGIENSAMEIE